MIARLIELNARLDAILLDANPLYRPEAQKGIHRIGKGRERMVRIRDITSTQHLVNGKKVAAMRGKDIGKLPTLQHRGHGKYVLHDGNHRANAALMDGKRKIKALCQR